MMIDFCPQCFASSENGSWDHVIVSGHCTNCGSSSTINIPEWAVKAIRQQASWVGKRYYPHEEDRERNAEREQLLKLVDKFPNRTAMFNGHDWTVTQRVGTTRSMIYVKAIDEESALEASRFTGLVYTG